jgi:hypothetical protein
MHATEQEDICESELGIPRLAAMAILMEYRKQTEAEGTHTDSDPTPEEEPEPEPEAASPRANDTTGGAGFPVGVSDGHCFISERGTGIVVAHMAVSAPSTYRLALYVGLRMLRLDLTGRMWRRVWLGAM